MTIEQALKTAQADCTPREWNEAETVLLKARLCPYCAEDGERQKLGRWQEGNASEYAGRECPMCESFFPCGPQPEYSDGPETDASGMCYSDALPGF